MKKSLVILAAIALAATCSLAQAMGVNVHDAVAHALPALASPDTAMALAGLGALGTTKLVQEGCTIDWTNGTGADVVSGQVVAIGQILGVALVDIADGEAGSVAISGVHTVPKVAGAVIAQGEALSWDASAAAFDDNQAVAAAGDITGAPAVAFEAAGNGVTTIAVKLTGVPGTVH